MDLGTTIKKIRKQKRLTQGEFSVQCGISQTYLSQIENNQKEPNLSVLKTIGENLKVPLPILFFLSMTEEDVQLNKREAFIIISPSIKSLVNEFFAV
jgi:transcriptional regulator with XRE-family HTH domain